MIVTKKFIFIHVPKTGGTFVREKLKLISRRYPDFFVEELIELKHSGVSKIPPQYSNLPILSCIRDPKSHLISRFNFQWWVRNADKRFNVELSKAKYPNFPNLDIEDFYDLICDPVFRNSNKVKKTQLLASEKSIGFNTLIYLNKFFPKLLNLLKIDNDEIIHEEIFNCFSKINFLNTNNLSEDLYLFLNKLNFLKNDILEEIKKSTKILPKMDPRIKNHNVNPKQKYTINNLPLSLEQKIKTRERFINRFINRSCV